jgi:phage FluMu gp28-like protein
MKNLFDLLLPYQKEFYLNPKRKKIFLSSRQVGKSFVAAMILVQKCLMKRGGTSLCVSVNQNSASEIIKKCVKVAEAVKLLTKGKITFAASFDKVVFSNGSRVISLSSNPASIRGYTACCCVVDECAFVEHLNEIIQAIGPTLTRDKNSELILLTTPAGKNGYFYEMYQHALKYPNTWYVQHTTIYDAVNDGLKVDVEEIKKLCPDDAVFRQEYCCEFANSNISLINTDSLKTFEGLPVIVDTFIGVDFGRTNDYTSICVVGRDDKNKCYLLDLTSLKNTEFSLQLEFIKEKFNTYNPKALYCDAGGLGKPLAEDLELNFNKRCKGFTFSQSNKHDAYTYFKKLVNAEELFIKKDYLKDIIEDVHNIVQIINDNGKVSYVAKRTGNGHSDRLTSLILALQASHDNIFAFNLPIVFTRSSRL